MKTIVEIFASKPELLDTEEVKELISQFKIQFDANKRKHMNYWDNVTELTMNSDLFVVNGIPCREVVEKIQNISFDSEFIGVA